MVWRSRMCLDDAERDGQRGQSDGVAGKFLRDKRRAENDPWYLSYSAIPGRAFSDAVGAGKGIKLGTFHHGHHDKRAGAAGVPVIENTSGVFAGAIAAL